MLYLNELFYRMWREVKIFGVLALGVCLALLCAVVFLSACITIALLMHHFLGVIGSTILIVALILLFLFYELGN